MAIEKEKRKKLPRGGLLAGSSFTVRVIIFSLILVFCAALSFTQLGFAGIGFENDYKSYAMVLLLPVSLAALLFGAVIGAVVGVAAGAMLYVHALVMPLDYYEFTYVTPLTSIVLLGLCGWALGLLFSFALRNNPKGIKRIVYIVIVCFIVSSFYSLGFILNAFIQTVADMTASLMSLEASGAAKPSQEEVSENLMRNGLVMVLRMGDVGMQVLVDAALMSISCCIVAYAVERMRQRKNDMGLRVLFATWMTAVVAIAFMVTAGVGFAAITQGELIKADEELRSEVNYLCTQIKGQDERTRALARFIDSLDIKADSLADESYDALAASVSSEGLLSGYTKEEDGIVVLSAFDPSSNAADIGKAIVYATDDKRFVVGHTLDEYLTSEVLSAMQRSLGEDKVERTIYDEVNMAELTVDNVESWPIESFVAYLYCKRAGDSLVLNAYPSSKVFSDRSITMSWTAITALALLLAVFLMVFQLLRRLVVSRIDNTNGVLGRITAGDLRARVEERSTREFSSLSDGINTTVSTLDGWITEAETRMDAELATAKAIQESALPRTFPPYPDIAKFDVYASMNAAREVGGDFYDFFLIGDDCSADAGKIGFTVADVSGKGVPASLFMMKAMTQIRDYLQSGMEVGEAIENANRQLCQGNNAGMFVTAWVGVLDYSTYHVDFVNAGHNPPLLWQKGGWRWVTEQSGLPLGLFEEFPYEAFSLECTIGDQLLIYSDGVTEAMNVDGELYGEQRLEELVNEKYALHPRRLVEEVRADVARHAKGAEQSDDITILALEVGVPPEMTATLTVPADVAELPNVNEFIHTELDRRLCPVRVQNQIDIAVEELFVNVAHYAYPDATPEKPGMVRISYTYSAEPPSVTIGIADKGIPYNPLAKPDAVTPDDIMEVPIGGLGILMAKKSVNEMTYEYVDDSNVVTLLKKW